MTLKASYLSLLSKNLWTQGEMRDGGGGTFCPVPLSSFSDNQDTFLRVPLFVSRERVKVRRSKKGAPSNPDVVCFYLLRGGSIVSVSLSLYLSLSPQCNSEEVGILGSRSTIVQYRNCRSFLTTPIF